MKTRILIIGVALFLSGCIAAPVPLPGKTQVEFRQDDDFAFIEEGVTTSEKVEAVLRRPVHEMENPDRWIYTMRLFTGGRWAFCFAQLVDETEALASCEKFDGKTRYEIFEIEFDVDGVVVETDKANIVTGKCTRRGICHWPDGYGGPDDAPY